MWKMYSMQSRDLKSCVFDGPKKWNIPLLNDLAQVMSDASICGLGQAASNPLKCVLKYFPEEVNDDSKA